MSDPFVCLVCTLAEPHLHTEAPTEWFAGPIVWTASESVLLNEPLRCECGTEKAGGGIHSTWCPKAEGR